MIAAERQRQIHVEGWTAEHDEQHENDNLVMAAVCYAMPRRERIYDDVTSTVPGWWPWEARFWKPTPDDRVRELVKAGALIAAEIDRLQS